MANVAWLRDRAGASQDLLSDAAEHLAGRVHAAPLSVRYSLAFTLALLAILLRVLTNKYWGSELPLITFYPAIVGAAWLCGLGPGLFTTVVSAFAAAYFWLPPAYSFRIANGTEALELSFFVITGVLMSTLMNLLDLTKQRFQVQSARLQTLINDAPMGIALFDRELRFLDLNEHAALMDGIPKCEHPGRTASELLPEIGLRIEKVLRQVRDTGEPIFGLDLSGQTPAAPGQQRHWIANFYPVRIEAGRVVEIVAIGLEITERKRVEEALAEATRMAQAAQAEAERANETKDRLMAMVSHELRSPLQAIMGGTQVLRAQVHDAEADTFLSLIERNTRLEARLVYDLVDIARISTGKLSVTLQTTRLRSIIETVIESMQPRFIEKRLSSHWETLGPDRTVLGDPERLQQIVSNLLSNAMKFTNSGGWINICLDRRNPSYVELRVSDSGIGMDESLIANVFMPFWQGDSGDHHTGLGLGLTIVKSLVELHGGTVQAQSEGVGKGSTFVVRLPVAELVDAAKSAIHEILPHNVGIATLDS